MVIEESFWDEYNASRERMAGVTWCALRNPHVTVR